MRCGISETVEPGVVWIGEPDRASLVDEEVIDAVEVVAEVVIEKSLGLVRVWIKRPNTGALFGSSNGIIAARGRL